MLGPVGPDNELDLTQVEEAADQADKPLLTYEKRDYEIALLHEYDRGNLAYGVIGLLIGLVVVALAGAIWLPQEVFDRWDRSMTTIFTAVVGLAGTVIGYYFGSGGNVMGRRSP